MSTETSTPMPLQATFDNHSNVNLYDPDDIEKSWVRFLTDLFASTEYVRKCDSMVTNPLANIRISEKCNASISWVEIQEAIRSCGNNKATGISNIPSEHWKVLSEVDEIKYNMSRDIKNMLSDIWDAGKIPDTWRESACIFLHKKGDKLNKNNYRTICLIDTGLKILCKIISKRLNSIAAEKGLLYARNRRDFAPKMNALDKPQLSLKCFKGEKTKE